MGASGAIDISLGVLGGRVACTGESAKPKTSSSRTACCDA